MKEIVRNPLEWRAKGPLKGTSFQYSFDKFELILMLVQV